jgi:peptidoglycan-N-acetylglucosamine deacetylase
MSGNEPRWPDARSAAISITLDNMGEAVEIGRGAWPSDAPVGDHYSVREALPRVLGLLEDQRARVTYFVEGWNTEVYPDAIREIVRRGHEVAYHGWVHESWSGLERGTEAELLARGKGAFERIGVTPRGFRPPGGVLTGSSFELLSENEFAYCSPAGRAAALVDGIVVLPFQWRAIDAYYYAEGFSPLRRLNGDPESTLPPERLLDAMMETVRETVDAGGYVALLFHPHLETDPQRFDAMRQVIDAVRSHPDVWCVPCAEVAEWVCAHPGRFAVDPELDRSTWTRR